MDGTSAAFCTSTALNLYLSLLRLLSDAHSQQESTDAIWKRALSIGKNRHLDGHIPGRTYTGVWNRRRTLPSGRD